MQDQLYIEDTGNHPFYAFYLDGKADFYPVPYPPYLLPHTHGLTHRGPYTTLVVLLRDLPVGHSIATPFRIARIRRKLYKAQLYYDAFLGTLAHNTTSGVCHGV